MTQYAGMNFYSLISYNHTPNLSWADNGFGEMVWVKQATWAYNIARSYEV